MSIRQAGPFAGQRRDLVTFGDPETSRLKTQFSSEGFLATRRLAGLTHDSRGFKFQQALPNKITYPNG